MNIGIDISQIIYKGTGVARFTRGLVHFILEYDTQNDWTFFFSSFRKKLDKETQKKMRASRHKIITASYPSTLLSLLSNKWHVPFKLLTFNSPLLTDLDWFITSDWTEPAMDCKKATIVHDLVFKKYPETVHPTILQTQQKRLKWVAKESDIIFADSQTTARDLIDEYAIEKSRVMINYPGVDAPSIPNSKRRKLILKRLGITHPFVLTVGKREPRKNMHRLIKAWNSLTKKYNKPLDLVIAGPKGWGDAAEKYHTAIKVLDYVTDDKLGALYSEAACFVYPSLYEGFGYPIIEAMHHRCPVACSNTSSLGEVAGPAAYTFDPTHEDDITNAMFDILTKSTFRTNLITKGLARAKKYSWRAYYNTLVTTLQNKP